MKYFVPFILLLPFSPLFSQTDSLENKKKWFSSFSLGGYIQVRYNGLFESNPNLGCDQCDKSWGNGQSLSLKRARLSLSAQIHPQLSIYIQPDFASAVGGSTNFVQLKDAYINIGIDKKNQFRFRVGLSKVPYGFEILQSSKYRLSLDRDEGINSAFSGERDLGVQFMWTPEKRKAIFQTILKEGLKGTGDYGVLTIGMMNGQPANTKELNSNKHVVFRASYPFYIKKQVFEASVQAYTGLYKMRASDISATVKHNIDLNYKDERVGASFVWYPKPFGFQAEYNIGRGPEYNKYTDSIELRNLAGGYVMVNYQLKLKDHTLIPFVKYKYYNGGKKFEQDARSYTINDLDLGIEWQLWKNFELTLMYSLSERRYEDAILTDNFQKGHVLRIQVQAKF